MIVVHAHWEPPSPAGAGLPDRRAGGAFFWAEGADTDTPQPPPARQRRTEPFGAAHGKPVETPKARKVKIHPFCLPAADLQSLLGETGEERTLTLRLPSTRAGPLPSPQLDHSWGPEGKSQPTLAPWRLSGIWVPPQAALLWLLRLPSLQEDRVGMRLGDDAHFWHRVAALALEALAAQKLVPLLVPLDPERGICHARWLPILDSSTDARRLAQLEAAMPPVCRASVSFGDQAPSPRALLTTFPNTTCDALARRWGGGSSPWPAAPPSLETDLEPAHEWLAALFRDDPQVRASAAQLQALAASHKAWMRNLYAAGDAAFRLAFRLEAPLQQTDVPQASWQLHYLLQPRDDPSLLVPAEAVWKARSGVLKRLNRRFEQPQEKLLAGLGYAARLFAPISESLKGRRPTQLSLTTQEAYLFLREVAPLLEGAGFGLLVPPWWNKPGARLGLRLRLQPSAGPGADAVPVSSLTMANLLNYQWELSLGDTSLTEEEFRTLASLKAPLVQIRGQWVQLDPEQIEAAIRFWEKQAIEGQMGLLEALQAGLGGQTETLGLPVDQVIPEGWLADWLERLSQPDRLEEVPPPTGFQGALCPYQRYGFSWLYFLRRWRLGACLANDMGLGKTIQTLALLLHEKETLGSLPAPTLLVCPTSVVTNWEKEACRFAPSLTLLPHQGTGRLRGEAFAQAAHSVDLVLTSYALVRQDPELIQAVDWWGVILDEAQNIKNPSAQQTQSVRGLRADFRLTLTGTPVENRLSELWSIMQFLNPGYLGSRQAFRRDFILPIERYSDPDALERLKKLAGPFILRRFKTDPRVIQDLPAKLEMKVYCQLTEKQATLYEAVVQDVMKRIEESEGVQRRGLVLSMLMQLKQICNHPAQYLHQVAEKASAGAVQGEPEELSKRSGKLLRLAEMLEEILAAGDRALIFTQFTEMGTLLAHYLLGALGCGVVFLHGGVPAKRRDRMISRFQEGRQGPPIFILSLKAGGTGLNLTRANHVFHFDRWWNPAVEDQATDRAYRIGQDRNVQVHKFVTVGTLEEMVDEMIERKRELARAVVGGGEEWLTELSTDDLRELVRLRETQRSVPP